MVDPVRTLLATIEAEVARLPGAALVRSPGSTRSGSSLAAAFVDVLGRPPPPGFKLFASLYDGGSLGGDVRLFSVAQSLARVRQASRTGEMKGLWPVLERGSRLYALDSESPGAEGEWPVVEVAERSADRVGSSFLRYLHALVGELLWDPKDEDADLPLARELCRRDPYLAEHWVELADCLEEAGKADEIDQVLAEGVRSASPVGPALMLALGLRAIDRGEESLARAAFDDGMALEPLTLRDDDARLDGAAIALMLALEAQDAEAADRAREILGPAAASTGGYWRGEALRCLAVDNRKRADFASRIVRALVPEDTDVERLRSPTPALLAAVRSLAKARDALDRGLPDEAVRAARAAVNEGSQLGACHAMLAEALNALRDKGAIDAAREAARLNPALIDAWRELGDAYLEGRQASKAEEAYREVLLRDPNHGFGLAKLSQALLEQGKASEALEAIKAAAERGGDPFFLAAVRGDILAEMNRHDEAAEAYDQALGIEPEDHWALHQAALEHGRAGNGDRAAELFEKALRFDRDGCHQTLIDYAELMRRQGRIGDAVRLYRRAVAAVPGDTEWRQSLREAERELQAAPN